MTVQEAEINLLVTATPGIAALLLSTAALVTAWAAHLRGTAADKVAKGNSKRLDHLENGGGDAKIDNRLASYGLVDRRGGEITPTVGPQAPADAPKGQERPLP